MNAATTPAAESRPLPPAAPRAWSMLRMQLLVEQRIFWRNRSGVFFTFVLPLLLLGFLGPFADPDLLVPGIAALAIASTGLQGLAMQLAMHRDQGVLKRIMATPLPPTLMLAGKIASILTVVVVEVVLVVCVGALAFDAGIPARPGLLVAAVALGTATFVSLGFAVASAIRTSESAPAVTNAIYLPLLFVSGVFHDIDELPVGVRAVGEALPLAPLAELMRSSWGSDAADGSAWPQAIILGAWCWIGVAWTVRRFRWEPASER